jgi:ribonuclease P protein component
MGSLPDVVHNQRFYKGERLKRNKRIDLLFNEGHHKKFSPFVLYYITYSPEEDFHYHKLLISVPKKYFKKSVIRNKIKRRIREAFRKHKSILYNNYPGLPFLLGYVYISKTVATYAEIEKSMLSSIRYLINKNKQTNEVAKK